MTWYPTVLDNSSGKEHQHTWDICKKSIHSEQSPKNDEWTFNHFLTSLTLGIETLYQNGIITTNKIG